MSSIRKRTWVSRDGTTQQAWLVDYRDQAGRRRAKQFRRKKEAEAWSTNADAEVQRGVHTPDSTSVTVKRAADLWLDGVRSHNREPTTIASYEQHVRLHIIPRCGAQKLSQLSAPKVRVLLNEWLATLSRPMATRVFRTFKAILTDAQERGLVAQNIALAVKVKKAPREKSQAMPPSKAELRAILNAAEASDDIKGRTMTMLVIFSGMRASEIRGLAWRSVDLSKKTVRIEQRADAAGSIGAPKSAAGFRTIPLPDRVISSLRQWKLACPAHPLDIVFPSQKGRVLSYSVMAKNHLKPIIVAAGVTKPGAAVDSQMAKYTAHIFRHAAASLWIEQGLNPKRVQSLVGHGSIQVTFDTYGHLFEEEQRDADDASAIERALFTDAT